MNHCDLLRAHPTRDETPRLEQLVEQELDLARAAITTREATNGMPGNVLLQLALTDEYRQHVDGLMSLLQVVQPDVDPAPMTDSLTGGGERRAEALEILDNVLPAKFKRRVLHLFESSGHRAGPDVLRDLLTGDWSEWVVIGAIYCAAESNRSDLIPVIEPHLKHGSVAISETADHALRTLGALARLDDFGDVTLVKRSTE